MSNTKMEPLKDHDSAEFLSLWLGANMVSLLVSRWLSWQLIEILWPSSPVPPNTFILRLITNPIPKVILVGLITGTLLGVFQWLIFRLWGIRITWKWIVSSALVCVVFPALREISHADIVCLVGGVLLGVAQWRLLKQIVYRASWWIVAAVVPSAGLLHSIAPTPYNTLFVGILLGGITGLLLVFLLKHPIHQSEVSFQQERG